MIFDHFFSRVRSHVPYPPTMLIIMDGWGLAPLSKGNVIARTKLPNLERLMATYPHTELIAAGESVGLPANEVGNTEVGHLTIGSGRPIYQGLKRINNAIESHSFYQNPAFLEAITRAKQRGTKLHLMGVLSSGNVHASLPHFMALIELCKHLDMTNVYVHAFADGRDAAPKEAGELLVQTQQKMESLRCGQFASMSGRYYAMDRDLRWERIQKVYEAVVEGKGPTAPDIGTAVKASYARGLTDELLEPTVLVKPDGTPIATIDDGDSVIFFNFRIDRPRQLSIAITDPNFEHLDPSQYGYSQNQASDAKQQSQLSKPFTRNKVPRDLFFVTMTNYQKNIRANAIAFNTEQVANPLCQVMADHQLLHFHTAESEKERFVTYYMNGFREDPLPGQETKIVPSPRVATYDKKPEMSVANVVRVVKQALNKGKFHFLVMNIANPDMVAHTGNIQATIKACQATDKAVGELADAILAQNGTLFITADHGNAEELITYPTTSFFFTSATGTMNTDHSNNPVPFIVVNQQFAGKPTLLPKGSLSDVAPTILSWMKLPVPAEMKGKNLLASLTGDSATQPPRPAPKTE